MLTCSNINMRLIEKTDKKQTEFSKYTQDVLSILLFHLFLFNIIKLEIL